MMTPPVMSSTLPKPNGFRIEDWHGPEMKAWSPADPASMTHGSNPTEMEARHLI
jgi:hypothetical protein